MFSLDFGSIEIFNLVAIYVVFLFSTVVHEAAHAWTALKLGDPTAYHGGQVSLNPIPHIKRSVVGLVVLPLIMLFSTGGLIGWASAPLDPFWAERNPRSASYVALAGPISNFLLALLAALLIKVGLAQGIFDQPLMINSLAGAVTSADNEIWGAFASILSVMFMLNITLGIFNLFPIPPLDGSSVIKLFMSHEVGVKYDNIVRQPYLSIMMFFALWHFAPQLLGPVKMLALQILYPDSSYQ